MDRYTYKLATKITRDINDVDHIRYINIELCSLASDIFLLVKDKIKERWTKLEMIKGGWLLDTFNNETRKIWKGWWSTKYYGYLTLGLSKCYAHEGDHGMDNTDYHLSLHVIIEAFNKILKKDDWRSILISRYMKR